jgi:hypothetical protein
MIKILIINILKCSKLRKPRHLILMHFRNNLMADNMEEFDA